ncbi:MAG: ATP-binding cassette domain-containing protein [Deltaproteobacteria bacterium]|nr:ATP-binding cassette domain-containing protein [Deltaproteobacteria bacterium]
MIEYLKVTKSFGGVKVLDRISLSIREGELVYIIGTSGAGKSVLMKHLVGLFAPDTGRIMLDGEDLSELSEADFFRIRKKCLLVFQHSTLFDAMTLRENVALPIRKHGNLLWRDALVSAMDFLSLVQMDHRADFYPAEVGAGEKKRVAIARALTMSPRYLILDEPTTGLDVIAAANVDNLIRDLPGHGVTTIVISHDLRSIFTVAKRVIFLYKCGVYLDGKPEDFLNSGDPVVRQFISGSHSGPME